MILMLLAGMLTALRPTPTAAADFADPAFNTVWTRTDKLVADGKTARTWFWGPTPGAVQQEDYSNASGGKRLVQYFDKSRMEINNPGGDKSSPFYVTNGLLTVELISGKIAVGDGKYQGGTAAAIPMTGDPGDTKAPTYAAFAGVSNTPLGDHKQADKTGQNVGNTIDVRGRVFSDTTGLPAVKLAHFVPETGHNIAEPFWTFLNQQGPVLEGGAQKTAALIDPWFYASGFPISDPYWAKQTVGGKISDVLIQAFERRVLTYTPSNPAGFQVEMGNIGQHYYDWRYKGAGTPKPKPTAPPTDTPAPAAPTATPIRVGGGALTVNGAGATFPAPIYTKWFQSYSANVDTNVSFNYQAIGSGAGISQITAKTVDFGASDAPLSDAQLTAAPGLLHIPTVAGAVVVAYNVDGNPANLVLDADTLSKIYLGDVDNWSDVEIKNLNPGVTLPNQDIVVVHRSDGSGTTNIFTDYLSAASPAWKNEVGKGTSVNWPVGLGGRGNAGVAGLVKQTPGAIGYVELAYAKQNSIAYTKMKNKAGQTVDATIDSVAAAVSGAISGVPDDLRVSIVNSADPGAWPIAGFT
jgi:phosphate transport system substrate-binding protein